MNTNVIEYQGETGAQWNAKLRALGQYLVCTYRHQDDLGWVNLCTSEMGGTRITRLASFDACTFDPALVPDNLPISYGFEQHGGYDAYGRELWPLQAAPTPELFLELMELAKEAAFTTDAMEDISGWPVGEAAYL